MPIDRDRRTVLGWGLGGILALGAGGYGWSQYRRRYHLRIWHLEAVNESSDSVTLSITVDRPGHEPTDHEVVLEGVDGDGATSERIGGRWMKTPAEWSIHATIGDTSIDLDAVEITETLPDGGWGTDCAHVELVATGDGGLEAKISSSDVC